MLDALKNVFRKPGGSPPTFAGSHTTTAARPLVIPNPSLGMLNLAGAACDALFERDLNDLGDLFPQNVNVGITTIPVCNVLFLYCGLQPRGEVTGYTFTLRDVIKAAGAHIAVVASENPPEVLTSPAFREFLGTKSDWPANIVITLNRNTDTFGRFFRKLFTQMRGGVSMPQAWVTLAPQGPTGQSDCPGTIALMEAGHVTFGRL